MQQQTHQQFLKTLQQIHQNSVGSQINNSTSKQQFSFGKSQRFNYKQNRNSTDIYYDVPNKRSTRATTFGVGDKHAGLGLQQLIRNPSPNAYEVKPIKSNKSVILLKGREEVKFNNLFSYADSKIPGPGSYNGKDQITRRSYSSYSFGAKIPAINPQNDKTIPGPGTYNLRNEKDKQVGQSVISKFRNLGVARINPLPKNKQDGQTTQKKSPGPGMYKIQSAGSMAKSYQSIAKFKSIKYGKFSSQKKGLPLSNSAQKDIPGPGSYRVPSDFGIY